VPGDPLAEDTFEAKSFIEIEAALAKESLDCTIHREPKKILITIAVARMPGSFSRAGTQFRELKITQNHVKCRCTQGLSALRAWTVPTPLPKRPPVGELT